MHSLWKGYSMTEQEKEIVGDLVQSVLDLLKEIERQDTKIAGLERDIEELKSESLRGKRMHHYPPVF